MKKNILLAATLAAIALTSCNNESEQANLVGKPEYITVSTHIGAMSRVVTNGNTSTFEDGDKISVYAWTGNGDEVNTAKLVVNNAVNTLKGAKWEAVPMMKWTDMMTPHYFLSIYPNRAITDFKADAVKVDPAKQEESDLLVATNFGDTKKGLIATNNPISLKFDHMMSKLVVKLEYRNEFSGTPTVTSATTEAKNVGSIDYIKGLITPSGTAAAFTLPVIIANKEFASVILPQSIQTVTVVIDGKNYVYTHPTSLTLGKGKIQTIKLIVGRNRIELDQVTINDWGTAEEITGGEAID
ncbi:fimbrillin family protein [Bacteroides ihuae]|uniref:fimbrillin family protein n=1 Tax=Bacteroides ihuae TaxID=1852362 RepID=UPI0008DA8667|nr:fimbrillin family protein [Bacteroides ihuae]